VAAGATSIHHLSWTCQLLATRPDVQERLFKEIDARREGAGSVLPSATERELADLESAPYLSAVVKESLRLYPPAPFLYRRGRDSHAVAVSIWGMHRHPRFWNQPNEFTPERWLGMNADPRAYMPFGLGPRTCIGRRFALIESRAALVEILRRFELKPAGPVPRPRLYIMTRPSRDIRLHVVPRDTVH
jgi:cytochrome P450